MKIHMPGNPAVDLLHHHLPPNRSAQVQKKNTPTITLSACPSFLKKKSPKKK